MRTLVALPVLLAFTPGCFARFDYAQVRVKHAQDVALETADAPPRTILPAGAVPGETTLPIEDGVTARRHEDGSIELTHPYRGHLDPALDLVLVRADGTVAPHSDGDEFPVIRADALPATRAETFRVALAEPRPSRLALATPWTNLEQVTVRSAPPRWLGAAEVIVGVSILVLAGAIFVDGVTSHSSAERVFGGGVGVGGAVVFASGLWMCAAPVEEHAWRPLHEVQGPRLRSAALQR
jgi:hypothetical protein